MARFPVSFACPFDKVEIVDSDRGIHGASRRVPVRMKILGKLTTVSVPIADAQQIRIGRAKFAAEKAKRTRRAKAAIRALGADTTSLVMIEAIDSVSDRAFAESSGTRLPILLNLIEAGPSELFWRVFMSEWSGCDDSWRVQGRLLRALRYHSEQSPPTTYFDEEQRQAFDRLPSLVPVYRGCCATRVSGLSWTLDRRVAAGFAKGHRGIPVPNPVIASAWVAKQHLFAILLDRQESEVILDPAKLADVDLASVSDGYASKKAVGNSNKPVPRRNLKS